VLDLVMESAAAHAGTAPTATQHEGDVA
jgi:hypothetical protein